MANDLCALVLPARKKSAGTRPAQAILHDVAKPRSRGAGWGTKQPISIRIDIDTLNAFRATGRGWQTRMNDVLMEVARAPLEITA